MKRYTNTCKTWYTPMVEDDDGDWVKYADIARKDETYPTLPEPHATPEEIEKYVSDMKAWLNGVTPTTVNDVM